LEEASKTWENQCGLVFAENVSNQFETQTNNTQTNWDDLLIEKHKIMDMLEETEASSPEV